MIKLDENYIFENIEEKDKNPANEQNKITVLIYEKKINYQINNLVLFNIIYK